MGGDPLKRRFRPLRRARDAAVYPAVHAGRRAFLQRLGLLTGGALAAPVLIRCAPDTAGDPSMPALSIQVSPDNPVILVGLTQQFSARDGGPWDEHYRDPDLPASWSSADPAVARIDQQGLAEGLAPGSTRISAAYNGHVDGTNLTVLAASVKRLAIVPASLTLERGSSEQLEAVAHLSGGGELVMTSRAHWSSSDPTIVELPTGYQEGRVKAVASGKATITAAISRPSPGYSAAIDVVVP